MRNFTIAILSFIPMYFVAGTIIEGILEGLIPVLPDFNGIGLLTGLLGSALIYIMMDSETDTDSGR